MKNFQFSTFNFQLFSLLCTCKNKLFILSSMIEKRISIGNIDPIDFYGINNAKFITCLLYTSIIITDGLAEGTRVITGGYQKISEGSKITF